MTERRRHQFIFLLVIGLALASLIVVAGIPGVTKAKKTQLGLDLKGGVELVYQASPTAESTVNATSIANAITIIQQRVDELGVAEPEISQVGSNEIDVSLPGATNVAAAENEVGQVAQLYIYDWEANVIEPNGTIAPATDGVVNGDSCSNSAGCATDGVKLYNAIETALLRKPILRSKRSTTAGGTWYEILKSKQEVLYPTSGGQGYDSLAALKTAIPNDKPLPAGATAVNVPVGTIIVQAVTPNGAPDPTLNSYYVLNDEPVVAGQDITNPQEVVDPSNGPVVQFGFKGGAANAFAKLTATIAQRGSNLSLPGNPQYQHFAVTLDGRLITVPYINFQSDPNGITNPNAGSEISGGFTITTAQNLANLLATGALPIKLTLISSDGVSATLGKQALNQGLIAGLAGFAIVAIFLLLFYRVLGMIAVSALVVYAMYFFALIKLIPITMTLPGIAGVILTIGVAADANIVIFERVKEELRTGRSVSSAIAAGYKRGFAAIVDANVVTFMTAFILFVLATSDVKGFAFNLGIGVLVSLFTAVAATQAILGTMGRSRVISSPSALGARGNHRRWTFDFMGNSRWFFSMSGTILLIGAIAIGGRGLNLGIDFVSGTQITTAFVQSPTENQIQATLSSVGVKDAQIQHVSAKNLGSAGGWQISTKTLSPATANTVEQTLQSKYQIRSNNYNETSVGPTFGKTVANSAIIAIIASLLVISIYIALRFEWKYAVPVLIALMHDLLITAGVYSLTGRQVTTSTVAALLTILGYSLYDTIIVFDRVRENVPRMPRAAFSQIVNRSMSEVLTRSLATSFCTLLPVLALLLFGGATLKDFAFALLVGVASGAYSSIFIASPVLTHWKEREAVYARRSQRIAAEHGGVVPAYAPFNAAEEAEDARGVKRRRTLTPPRPDGQVSRQEFAEMVEDLDVGEKASVAASKPVADPTADAAPEDVVMPSDSSTPKNRTRNRRHGRKR